MRIAIDSDSNGAELKSAICEHVRARGFDIEDLDYLAARDADYPDIGFSLARRVQAGDFDRGILTCGTGEGMAMFEEIDRCWGDDVLYEQYCDDQGRERYWIIKCRCEDGRCVEDPEDTYDPDAGDEEPAWLYVFDGLGISA